MQPTLETRKPVEDLDEEDLSTFKIWEFITDEESDDEEEDETWVRPVKKVVIPKDEYSLLVSANLITHSGTQFHGLIVVSTDDTFEVNGGIIFHQNEHVHLPAQDFWNAVEDNRNAVASLGMSESEVFPITYTLLVPVDGETVVRTGEFKV